MKRENERPRRPDDSGAAERAKTLAISEFQDASALRTHHEYPECAGWSLTDWCCALAGEVGEFCNLAKKKRRGERVHISALASELGDILAYLVLTAEKCGVSLAQAAAIKFNKVSERRGGGYYL